MSDFLARRFNAAALVWGYWRVSCIARGRTLAQQRKQFVIAWRHIEFELCVSQGCSAPYGLTHVRSSSGRGNGIAVNSAQYATFHLMDQPTEGI